MIRTRTLIVLGSLTIAVIAAIVATLQPATNHVDSSGPQSGDKMFPQLGNRVNDIARIAVRQGDDTITVERQDGQWVLTNLSNYPADVGKIRQLILGMTDLIRLEPKTQNPELFEKLGVIEPKAGNTESRLIELTNGSGDYTLALIIGKEKPAKTSTRLSEYYVRVPQEEQAWLAQGNIPLPRAANEWLETQLINIALNRLSRLAVHHSNGETVIIEKSGPEATDFQIVEPKRPEKVRSTFTVNNMAQSMATLMLQDVTSKEAAVQDPQDHFTAELKTFDGLTVTLSVQKSGEDYFGVIGASAQAPVPPPATSEKETATDSANNPDPARDAETINARGKSWRFKLSSFAVESIAKRSSDLYETESKSKDTPPEGATRPALDMKNDIPSFDSMPKPEPEPEPEPNIDQSDEIDIREIPPSGEAP